MRSRSSRFPLYVTLGAVATLLLVSFVVTCARCDGHFEYTLDDPYIHLALARQIAHGHYGINPLEPSAPSSSILWPFLLAPFAATPFLAFVPLLLNVLFCLLSAAATVACFEEIFRDDVDERRPLRVGAWSLATILAANGVAIAFTGMEHGLQIWLTVLAAYGLIRIFRGGPTPRSLPIALALAPLVRYENLALTLAACAFLFWRGRRKTAVVAALLPIAAIVAFSLFLRSEGLGIFPSSVMAKSFGLARLGGILPSTPGSGGLRHGSHAFDALSRKLFTAEGRVFLLFVALVVAFALPRHRKEATGLWAVLAFALLAQVCVGDVGWFQRYQMFDYAFGTILLVFLRRQAPLLPLPRSASAPGLVPVAFYFALIGWTSLETMGDSPEASACVYRQQHQTMRFVRDFYRGPVAVNDIGEVAYGSNQSVLDLWGLASLDALKARLSSSGSPDWSARVVDAHRVGLVAIYDSWFPVRPADWRLEGRMKVNVPLASIAGDTVSFYATRWGDEAAIRKGLVQFRKTLPNGASLALE